MVNTILKFIYKKTFWSILVQLQQKKHFNTNYYLQNES